MFSNVTENWLKYKSTMDVTDDNRSWAEICEEELYNDEAAAEIEAYEKSFEDGEIRDNSFAVP